MKKLLLLLFVIFSCNADPKQVPDDAFTIDTIAAVMFGQGGTEIVTASDIMRPSLTGAAQKRDDIIFERLVYLDAQKYKIAPDEDAVDKYLSEIQRQNNLTLDDLKQIFQQSGYTYEEGREQFKRLQTVKSLLDYKINSNLIVPRHQIEQYYNEHPIKEEAEYQLAYGTMPFNDDRQEQEKQLKEFVHNKVDDPGITWNEPFWLKESEIADDKQFIYRLKKGEISSAHQTPTGFELYHLLDKKEERLVPLQERYTDIARELTQPKYEKLMNDYKKQLFDLVSIVYF